MKKRKYIMGLLSTMLLAIACSESLEDTYGDYTDGGRIRYVGKCYDVKTVPGWKRLTLNWKRATDEAAKNIKVVWTLNDGKDSTLLEPDCSSFEIPALTDGTYRFDLTVIDNAGEESLVETVYGRPYTETHEIVRTFTNVVTKSWQVGNVLICCIDKWNDNIKDVQLQYKNTQGQVDSVRLEKEDFIDPENPDPSQLFVLEGVSNNPEDSITILRRGMVEGCPDLIDFAPIVMSKNRVFTTDFLLTLETRYGLSSETDEELVKLNHFIDTVKTLEFDYDMASLEDVLYCPNFEKVVIGKNRYLTTLTEKADKSVLEEVEKSIAILDKANELCGVTVERYGNHYFKNASALPYMEDKGKSVLPDLDYVARVAIDSVTSSVENDRGKLTLEYLLDDNSNTRWETTNVGLVRSYELTIYLKEEIDIRGIKVVQPVYEWWDMEIPSYLAPSIQVKTSVNQIDWEDVTYAEENTLGKGSGEATLLSMKEGTRRARYIKVLLVDQVSGVNARAMIGDVMIFR